MVPPNPPKRRLLPALGLAAACVLGPAAPAAAFDTGHHHDLTAAGLAAEGFGKAAIRQAQLANWITDYLNTPVQPDQALARRFDLFHFDDLPTDEGVRARWAGTVTNMRRVVTERAAAGDAEGVVTALGMTLHSVQDFYSHSNWTESHPRLADGAFRTETYFSDPTPALPLRTSMHPDRAEGRNHVHGDYHFGMNKDSHVRQGWSEAYVFAHVATREWINAVRGWAEAARPGIWAACAAYRPGAAADAEMRRQVTVARRLSAYGSFGVLSDFAFVRKVVPTGVDGHWKGNGSGTFVGLVLTAIGGPSPRGSAVADRVIELAGPLADGLASWDMSPQQVAMIAAAGGGGGVSEHRIAGRVLAVRTLRVRAIAGGLDPVGPPDLYSKVEVAGQSYVEAPQMDRAEARPAWHTLAVLPTTTGPVPITYMLADHDFPDADDPVALGPKGPLRFTFDPATGRVDGLPAGSRVQPAGPGAVEVTVRGREAEVRLRLASTALAPAARRFETREAGI